MICALGFCLSRGGDNKAAIDPRSRSSSLSSVSKPSSLPCFLSSIPATTKFISESLSTTTSRSFPLRTTLVGVLNPFCSTVRVEGASSGLKILRLSGDFFFSRTGGQTFLGGCSDSDSESLPYKNKGRWAGCLCRAPPNGPSTNLGAGLGLSGREARSVSVGGDRDSKKPESAETG